MGAVIAAIIIILVVAVTAAIVVAIKLKKQPTSQPTKRSKPPIRKSPDEFAAQLAGDQGEAIVRRALGKSVPGERYVFNNYSLFDGVYSTQIDHIVVNRCGVFVIETKNLGGSVNGGASDEYWLHVKTNGEIERMRNPLRQNATHVNKVRKLLGDVPTFSLVVFVRDNLPPIVCDELATLSELPTRLLDREKALSSAQIDRVAEKLRLNDAHLTHEQHTDNLLRVNAALKKGVCPKCGGKLVLRHGRYNDFYGCSNYPKCDFKTNKLP